jgi:LuxR family maltose regulon positive regulatory protein
MPDLDPLIATRLHIPPTRADLLARPALDRLLDAALDLPLTLISAPPGFGKTALAASWLSNKRAGGVLCAWLTLQPSDNLSAAFWRYLTASLQAACPGFGAALQPLLSQATPPAAVTIAAYLVNDLAGLARPLLLVLDDYHAVHLPEIHAGVNLLLDHAPENFHLILATREDPPLALARRRARRQMVEIRARELRFQPDETARYFRQALDLSLDPAQLQAVDRRVEGWAAGLQLTALSLQDRPDPAAFLQSLAGVDRAVADYLVEEVLERQDRPVREFLLKTSVLEALSAPLCEALLEGTSLFNPCCDDLLLSPSAALIDRLERANLFLTPLGPDREWFRYHPLFAGLLRQRLRQVYGEDEVRRLTGLASRWFEERGDPAGAISYAFQSGDPLLAADLLQQFAPRFFIRADLPQFLAWVNQVPAPIRETLPNLCMAAAWAALATNQAAEGAALLAMVEKYLGQDPSLALADADLDLARRAALLEILVLRLRLDSLEEQPDPLAFLQKLTAALEALPDDQLGLFSNVAALKPVAAFNLAIQFEFSGYLSSALPVFRQAAELGRQNFNVHIMLLSLSHLGNIHMQLGEFDAAREAFEEALARAFELSQGDSPFAALAYTGLGWLDYEANSLEEARSHFQTARRLAVPWYNWESLVPAVLGLAAIHQALGDPLSALHEVEEFLKTEKCTLQVFLAPLEAEYALLLGEIGRAPAVREARKWLSAHPPIQDTFDENGLARARLLILADLAPEAEDTLRCVIAAAEEHGLRPAAVRARIQLAKAMAARGEIRPAAETLQTALEDARSGRSLRVFLDGGETVRRLLLVLRSSLGPTHPLAGYLRSLLTWFVSGEEAFSSVDESGGLIEPLSDREHEVLQLLAEGLSNKDIAARLVISLATVKTHIANIYQKLDAASRTQAVARAESLGLLKN